ncbi:MAG: tetratricopeptide repeat protein [Novosphingobium sp.]|nr:tetratricopeptide repeat protein [Novosphingobium sp.]MCP5401529.1 tetratricopeptide repeat protein [Novosphingobium sp.]
MSGLESSIVKARKAENRGDFAEAERIYGTVLEKFPRNARARRGLDQVFKRRALEQLKADAPPEPLMEQLAETYRQGQMAQVVTQAEKLLESYPRAVMAYNLLGAAHLALGRHPQAESALSRARAKGIRHAPICNNHGMALSRLGRMPEAEAAYREAIAIDPGHAIAHNNLGNVLKENQSFAEALACYLQAIEIRPDYADAWNNMALALEGLGRVEEAQACYRKVLELKPDHAPACCNLGNLLAGQGDLNSAIAFYEAALRFDPDYPEAHLNLGNAYKRQDRIAEATSAYERAKVARPRYADAWIEEAKALALNGRLEEAITAFGKALEIEPGNQSAHAHRLFYQAHVCDWSDREGWAAFGTMADDAIQPWAALTFEDDPAAQLRRSQAWASTTFSHLSGSMPQPAPAPDGRIRIGYFTADFHDHPMLYLMAGLFREHDRSKFEIFVYSYGPKPVSEMREKVLPYIDHVFEIRDMPDKDVVELARGHGIDIAIDRKGYTQNARPQLFAHRLAPIQINYLAYPGSMGADFIDYIVADPVIIPEGEQHHYSEKIIYLPGSYQPNDNRREIAQTATSRADFGLPEDGFVFCSFNQTYKIGPREFDIWMRLLDRVDGSVLWLLRSNAWAETNLRREAAKRGVSPGRLIFADKVPHAEHLARLKHADLFVDSFNVNAHTTASDALWAGLPVVTKIGRQFAARVSASLINAVGLPELIVETEEDYEALILDLATDPGKLSAIRATLAENRLTRPLFDTTSYTRHLETAFETVHQRRIDGQAPATLTVSEA